MKKTTFLIFTLLLLSACDQKGPQRPHSNPPKCGDKWIVEQKEVGHYTMASKRYLRISNLEDPTNLQLIEVGQYTFKHIAIGDTITYRIGKFAHYR